MRLESIERETMSGSEPYDWNQRAVIGRTYDIIGFLSYVPKCHFLSGRERGDRKTYHLKLYNTVNNLVDVFVETKSIESEVYLNIATNFQGALIYIEDCEAIAGDIFQLDKTHITLTCINFHQNKENFLKFEKYPDVIFHVDESLSTGSIDTFIVPPEMQDTVLNAMRLSRLRKTFMTFSSEKLEKIKSFFARELFYRERGAYIDQREVNEKIFSIDPFKYLESADIVKGLIYNHCGIVNALVDSGDQLTLTIGGFKFVLEKSQFPGICEHIRLSSLIIFPHNVILTHENIFSLKNDSFLTLVDDMDSLSSVVQVRKVMIHDS